MGNKTDHLSTSKLGHALDFSLADPADRQILDEQVVSDILDSRSDDDDGDDTEKTMDEYISRLAQQTETLDSDTLRATSRIKIHPFNKTSWTQRVLSWLMSRFGRSDLR